MSATEKSTVTPVDDDVEAAWSTLAAQLVAMSEAEQAKEDAAEVEAQVAEATLIIAESEGRAAAAEPW